MARIIRMARTAAGRTSLSHPISLRDASALGTNRGAGRSIENVSVVMGTDVSQVGCTMYVESVSSQQWIVFLAAHCLELQTLHAAELRRD